MDARTEDIYDDVLRNDHILRTRQDFLEMVQRYRFVFFPIFVLQMEMKKIIVGEYYWKQRRAKVIKFLGEKHITLSYLKEANKWVESEAGNMSTAIRVKKQPKRQRRRRRRGKNGRRTHSSSSEFDSYDENRKRYLVYHPEARGNLGPGWYYDDIEPETLDGLYSKKGPPPPDPRCQAARRELSKHNHKHRVLSRSLSMSPKRESKIARDQMRSPIHDEERKRARAHMEHELSLLGMAGFVPPIRSESELEEMLLENISDSSAEERF